jgi:hypothetical protein
LINTSNLGPDQLSDPEPPPRPVARELYDWVANLLTTSLLVDEDAHEMVRELVYALCSEKPTCSKCIP